MVFRNNNVEKIKNVAVHFTNAFKYVETCQEKYDTIIMNTVDPYLETSVAKILISKKWYDILGNCLNI